MPHRAFGIYVHITWHTRFRQSLIRSADVDSVRAAIHEAASRGHVGISWSPSRGLMYGPRVFTLPGST